MKFENMSQYKVDLLKSLIDDPSFDEKAWKRIFVDVIKAYNFPYAPEIFRALLRSPVADLGTIDDYSHLMFKYMDAGKWLGENPMMTLWIETHSESDDFPWVAKAAMCNALNDWVGVELRQLTINQTILRSLFDIIKDPRWAFVFQSPTGEEQDCFYDDFVRDYINGEVLALCGEVDDAGKMKRAMIAHDLLVALCAACGVEVPKNVFSCLEEQ